MTETVKTVRRDARSLIVRVTGWLLWGLLGGGVAWGAQQYTSTVTIVQSPNYNVDCIYFQLSGVAQADPVNPNNPRFAVPPTQNGYSELFAMLITAKVSGSTVEVFTTGAAAGGACGSYAGVAWVNLE